MRRVLLLCFIHGFKGGSSTFGQFPEELRQALTHALLDYQVVVEIYPQYQTRGELKTCVEDFREWLDSVIARLEVAACSVRAVLIGHSMGGFVAAGAVISLVTEPRSSHASIRHIRGILAFDTPFLGVNAGVLANGAETSSSVVHSVAATMTRVFQDIIAWSQDLATAKRWLVYLLCTAAISLGTKVLYSNRDTAIRSGSSWAGSHIQFISCLADREELQKGLTMLVDLHRGGQVFFVNIVTALRQDISGLLAVDIPRTFCILPPDGTEPRESFHLIVNCRAVSEIEAHTQMFVPSHCPNYYAMRDLATTRIAEWSTRD